MFANELGTFQDASSIRIRYRAALARAGLRQLRFHDLRHTFGTLAVRRAEVPAVQAWMGHSDIQTTMRYVHHRDRGGEAKLLAEAFRPAGTFRGRFKAGTSRDGVPRTLKEEFQEGVSEALGRDGFGWVSLFRRRQDTDGIETGG